MLFVEAGRQTKVRQFDMPIFVNEDVIRLDITTRSVSSIPEKDARSCILLTDG